MKGVTNNNRRVGMKPDFERYLRDKHAEQYTGTDDFMPDDFEDWLCDLDIDDVIALANEWAGGLVNEPR